MTIFRKTWDFVYGTFLIAAAPFCGALIVGAPLHFILSPFLKRAAEKGGFHIVYLVEGFLPLIGGAIAFGIAINYRLSHRIISKSFMAAEILFALVAAFSFFCLLGLLLYPG